MSVQAQRERITIRVSVRSMVESVIMQGDLYSQAGYDTLSDAAQAHRDLQAIQKAAGEGFRAEVSVKLSIERGPIILELSGRIDGLTDGIADGGPPVLQEIKTISSQADFPAEEDNSVYWAQAICYGHMLCEERDIGAVLIQLLYVKRGEKRDGNSSLSYERLMTRDELKTAFFQVAGIYIARCEREFLRSKKRNETIESLPFPFDSYRAGQREMMRCSYLTMIEKRRAFVEAPTGTGKTAAALYPALHALREDACERIFYLTARTTVAQSVIELLEKMREQGLFIKSVHISAKDKACLLEKRDCNPAVCPYARGYYDKISAVLERAIEENDIFTLRNMKEIGRREVVCPFELSLDLALLCDIIICDYNYVFDPAAQLKRFFMNGKSGGYALLIDEAHNLPQRSRDMFTAALEHKSFTDLRRALSVKGRKWALYKAVAEFCRDFKPLSDMPEISEKMPEGFVEAAKKCCDALQEYVPSGMAFESMLMDCMFALIFFCKIAQGYDQRYITRIHSQGGAKSADIQLLCLDASVELKRVLEKCGGALFFSATLSPVDYYKSSCGAEQNDFHLTLPSPFPRENLFVCNVPLHVGYKNRDISMGEVTRALKAMISAKKGNYIAFFPSYAYMKRAFKAFCEAYPDIDAIIQRADMPEDDRLSFLENFQEAGEVLAFCVLGGIFAQGVDLPGKRLIGAAVVSVGLPQIGPEVQALKAYYDGQSMDGFGFALRYPGICKVLQAAGRVIRSENDKGAVLLIDARYMNSEYADLLPGHFHPVPVYSADKLPEKLAAFWRE
ncbi:MAG: ATP-dependent DNA helicase [Christensenellales bacterium]|jgi:DNA excision repair protein ERCC-2